MSIIADELVRRYMRIEALEADLARYKALAGELAEQKDAAPYKADNLDYDEFAVWYAHEAPDESEITVADMAYTAWQRGRLTMSQQTTADLARMKALAGELSEALDEIADLCHPDQRWVVNTKWIHTRAMAVLAKYEQEKGV